MNPTHQPSTISHRPSPIPHYSPLAPRPSPLAAFTLIELMVVIGIIILLGSLLFPAITAIKNQANKAKASAAVSHLGIAASGYYNDYGKWPEINTPNQLVMVFNGGVNPLTGSEDGAGKQQNPRKIVYMEFKTKELIASGSGAGGGGDGSGGGEVQYYDPWGTPYAFCFDNGKAGFATGTGWKDSVAYDNVVTKPYQDGVPGDNINTGAAFFSNGPDQRTGNQPSNPQNTASQTQAYEDDIRSWK